MCGQLSSGTDELFADWFQDCTVKSTSESYQLTIIRKCLLSKYYYDDVNIPLTAPLLKMIHKRARTGKDGHTKRPSLVNAMEGLSPFAMFDIDADAVALFNDEDTLI